RLLRHGSRLVERATALRLVPRSRGAAHDVRGDRLDHAADDLHRGAVPSPRGAAAGARAGRLNTMATNYLPGADMERFLEDAMAFAGFNHDDIAVIRRTGHLVLEQEAALTTALYDHFLSMPDSARFFLGPDGTSDRPRIERRKHSLARWL